MSADKIRVFEDFGEVEVRFIEDFEKNKNICLPQPYKRFISKHNGATLENEYFKFFCPYQNKMDSSSFYFLGYGSRDDLILSSEDVINNQNFDVYGYEGLVTFGRNGGGDYICFDYRGCEKSDEPKVIFMLHDDYDEEQNKMKIFFVASNFDQFCDLLYEEFWDN